MPAVIGDANDVPSHAAQPSNAIHGSAGSGLGPVACLVLPLVNVDCRFTPRAAASTHQPKLLKSAFCQCASFSSTAPTASTCLNAAGQNGRLLPALPAAATTTLRCLRIALSAQAIASGAASSIV